jgi:cell division protein FtsQ
MTDRLAERSAMRRHRTWRRVVAWVLTLAVLAGVVWAAFWSPVLALDSREVAITGAVGTVDRGAVDRVLAGQRGVPLPRLDTVALRQEILDLRGVKDVRVARSWPRGLEVAVTARVPVAAVPDGGRYVLLDAEGVRVGTRDAAPAKLPEVDVPLDDGNALALQSALRVLAALPPGLSKQVASVNAETQDDVETVLRDGQSIQWGGRAQLALKVEIVRTLRKVEPEARVIDVSSPELPVTR